MNPEQRPLLKIRRRPEPLELRIKSEVIRQYVREKLDGLPARQADRARRREFKREQDKQSTAQRKEQNNVRVIKVSFRAIFEGPKRGALNPLGLTMPGRFPVEVFQVNKQTPGNKWKAREIETPAKRVYERLQNFASATNGMQVVEQSFDKQLEPWQMWGVPPGIDNYNPPGTERLLLPEEIHECAGGVYQFRGPEDFTHIAPPQDAIRGNQCATRCNAHVSVKMIVSTRANIAPTCPTCAGIYAQEYAHA